jgi:HK97 family phage prohead protease
MEKQVFPTVVLATGDEPSITVSTNDEDRDGDVCVPSGAVLTNYQKNPVVLFGHDYSALPVGSSTSVSVGTNGIVASWRWLENDTFADRVRNAFEQGVLRAASIGFRPLESAARGDGSGRVYTKWELLEWSLVPVPANASAVRTLKRLNLWHDDDGDDIALRLVESDNDRIVLRLKDDIPALDRFARGRQGRGEVFAFDAADVTAALAGVLPEMVGDIVKSIPALVANELARKRGRVD